MAQVVPDPQLRDTIDDYLDYLLCEWRGIPALADEWDEWDAHSQLVFAIDWGVPEDRLHQLQQWCAAGLFTPAQRARYDQLLELVARHRPVLEELLADEPRPAARTPAGAASSDDA